LGHLYFNPTLGKGCLRNNSIKNNAPTKNRRTRTFTAGRGVWLTLQFGSGLTAMAGVYEWFQGALSWNKALFAVALVLLCFLWARTLKLDLTEAGVSYRSGPFYRSLAWTDVGVVGFRWKDSPGYGGIDSDPSSVSVFRFESRTPGRRSIQFSPAFFSRRDCQAMEGLAAVHLRTVRKESQPPEP
jgi:hypothetical protein